MLLALGAAGVVAEPFDAQALPRMLELMLDEAREERERRPPAPAAGIHGAGAAPGS